MMRRSSWCAIAVLLTLSGCGDSQRLASLSGHVTTTEGTPLVGARLIFRSDVAGTYAARTDAEGNYVAGSPAGGEGIAPGSYSVTVVEDLGDSDHPNKPMIAARYGLVDKSGLHVTVPAEEDRYDLVLEARDD